jgi:hypothetical protein
MGFTELAHENPTLVGIDRSRNVRKTFGAQAQGGLEKFGFWR